MSDTMEGNRWWCSWTIKERNNSNFFNIEGHEHGEERKERDLKNKFTFGKKD